MKDSSKVLGFPEFDVPDLPSKPMTTVAYRAWLSRVRHRLLKSGRLDAILSDPIRQPVDVRFSL